MGKLTGFADKINIIDKSSILSFTDLIRRDTIKNGLFIKSVDFRNRNLMSNYESGFSFRAKKSDLNVDLYEQYDYIDPVYKIIRSSTMFNVGVGEGADIIQDNNSNLRFITTDDFTLLQDYIREYRVNITKSRTIPDLDYSVQKGKTAQNYMAYFDIGYNADSALENSEYGYSVKLNYLPSYVREKLYLSSRIFDASKIIRENIVEKVYTKSKLEKIYATLDELKLDFIPDEQNLRSIEDKSTYVQKNVNFDSGDTLTSYDEITKTRINSFYQEDNVFSIGKSDTTFNTTVRIDNFDNMSRLLKKTNEIFKEKKTKTLINRFSTGELENRNTDLETSFSKYGLSRGRNLLKKELSGNEYETGFFNPYCRVWTASHQYSKLKHRIRPFYDEKGTPTTIEELQRNYGNLRPNGSQRLGNNTVLKDNGFVRMGPEYDSSGGLDKSNIQKYMFSIENLAWRDSYSNLSEEQIGPNKGRIMWFPPYNLKFSENINVEWNSHKFIGRGEQIYTYTNTDRGGTLSFTLLIDHPSILNKWRTTSKTYEIEHEDDLLRFFAGCGILDGNITGSPDEIPAKPDQKEPPKNPKPGKKTTTYAYVMFFPNNYTGLIDGEDDSKAMERLQKYENSEDFGEDNIIPFEVDTKFKDHTKWSGNTCHYKLNYSLTDDLKDRVRKTLLSSEDENTEIIPIFNPDSGYTQLPSLITNDKLFGKDKGNSKIEKIRIKGYASSHGLPDINTELSERRKQRVKTILKKCNEISDDSLYQEGGDDVIPMPTTNNTNGTINAIEAKIARSAVALIDVVWDENSKASNSVIIENGNSYTLHDQQLESESNTTETEQRMASRTDVIKNDDYSYDNEYLYFSKIKDDEMVYRSIMDKVRFFDPAFHSITPEGFNSRLTFLQQCTRQGPTISISGGKVDSESDAYLRYAGNLAFGRPPYCVLRIGDFFYTKICITSLSIDYDSGSGLQWDLNPEGAGVQPMFANININFNFIGGQDIEGPVARLQNAISHNYYANASIYDKRSKFGQTGMN